MGWVSFFNDLSSEMIYPIVPIFLTSVLGAPATVVGLIEGVADSASSFLKIISGWLSDKLQKRKIFVVFGYSFSALAKTLFAVAINWQIVLAGRFLDRLGKGARTAPRDALINESASQNEKGRAFGFHRAMDTLGAIGGPLIAVTLLQRLDNDYHLIFLIAAIPSFFGVLLLILFVKEKKKAVKHNGNGFADWGLMNADFKKFMLVSFVFALGSSSEAFLILRAQDLGLTVAATILIYASINAVYAVSSIPAGELGDKIGHKKIIMGGFAIFAIAYFMLSNINNAVWLWLTFPLYGLYLGMTNGASRAHIARLVPKEQSATAFGLYETIIGVCAFASSFFAGLLWTYAGPSATFMLGFLTATMALVLFAFTQRKSKKV